MLSMPPDTTISAEPALMMSCASMVAFMPEPQTLLMVVAPVASGGPPPRAAWRAGAWPCPAGSTHPMNTSSIRSGASFARSTAAPMTCEPSLCALNGDRSPMNLPSGVRAAETMTTGSEAVAMAGAPLSSAKQSITLRLSYDALRNLQREGGDKLSGGDIFPHFSRKGRGEDECCALLGLPLPIDKSLHQPLRLARQARMPA